ncbi:MULTISPECIES: DMT family transporter [Primorskyibacter]|uniref:EamA-like transporter family protein n=1 Tax=Primorskyibacter flagellatus TaxID=1387277 RepID=A0A1W2EL18_9RHOB|nr:MULTISPECIES: DMT family transporter [Primorskyibacter]SMD10410.1 EamA-like transporter family protein [Primorskyibacter flagellatus]
MSGETFFIVVFAAFLHALWNAIVKGAGDRTLVLGLVASGHVVPGCVLIYLYGMPDRAAFPYIVATTVIHWGYYILLNMAYRTGDLSVVYPIARGFAPVLIALGAVIWADEYLPLTAWIGVFAVSGGIMLLASEAFASRAARSGLVAAVGLAAVIASYSIVDGIGIRVSNNPGSYIGWIFAAEIFVVLYVFGTRWSRFRAMSSKAIWIGLTGGIVSGAAYGLVLLAKTTAPLGIVSALRETSVIFAALIGVLWFAEGPRGSRIIAAVVVAAGVALSVGARV